MEKLKKLFSTPERKVITVVCIVLILAIAGAGTVMAVRANAQHNAIGVENAQNFAFADAGVDPASARVEHTEFEFENGRFVYEIEFTADGAEYDYLVSAADGAIVKKEVERVRGGTAGEPVPATVTLEAAKDAALADAGLTESDVTFTKTRLDTEDGFAVYDIDFYTADSEYEYEINAETGEVFSRSREVWNGGRPAAQPTIAPTAAPSEAPIAAPSVGPSAVPTSDGYIGADAAKDAALADAGLVASDVTFTKEKFDWDDGRAVYDIEFYGADAEYEYEIDALTGAVISKSKETWGGRPAAQTTSAPTPAPTAVPSVEPSAVPTVTPTSDGYIGADAAKDAALADAGLAASDVTFTKEKFDWDDGRAVYDIEFYGADAEYEYEIDALTGAVIGKSKEIWGGRPAAQTTSAPTPAPTAAPSVEPSAVPTAAPTSDGYIGADAAKDAALTDAGLAASDVTFVKQEFDHDDGRAVYEVEFYSGGVEYEYKIDAATGAVLERDVDHDHH